MSSNSVLNSCMNVRASVLSQNEIIWREIGLSVLFCLVNNVHLRISSTRYEFYLVHIFFLLNQVVLARKTLHQSVPTNSKTQGQGFCASK